MAFVYVNPRIPRPVVKTALPSDLLRQVGMPLMMTIILCLDGVGFLSSAKQPCVCMVRVDFAGAGSGTNLSRSALTFFLNSGLSIRVEDLKANRDR